MFIATTTLSVLLAIALVGSAVGKLTRNPAVIGPVTGVGVPAGRIPLLAALEIAGAVGLLVGLAWPPLGIAAAVGVVLYFLGAVIAHLRVRDGGYGPAAGLLVFSVVVLVLRTITA